jgi:lipid II:glycine glycyltransferase (peptidoglycan interpeptide bridge formation enzyme)
MSLVELGEGDESQTPQWARMEMAEGKLPILIIRGQSLLVGSLTKALWGQVRILRFSGGPVFPSGQFDKDLFEDFIKDIDSIGKLVHATFVTFFPKVDYRNMEAAHALVRFGFQKVEGFQPCETYIIDLRQPEDILWRNLANSTRKHIRKGDANELEVIEKWDLESFCRLWPRSTMKSRTQLINLHREIDSARMFFARSPQGYVSAALLVGSTCSIKYYLGGTSRQGKGIGGEWLLWKLILMSKNSYKWFDLGGAMVTQRCYRRSSKEQTKYAGVSSFKRGFGGSLKRYLGQFDKAYNNRSTVPSCGAKLLS